jgi:competence protein ComEC
MFSFRKGAAAAAWPGSAPDRVRATQAARAGWRDPIGAFGAALRAEADQRRIFLWTPVAAGAGAVTYFSADHEPSLWLSALLAAALGALAFRVRANSVALAGCLAAALFFTGFVTAAWRSARLAAPVLDHVHIVELTGFVEAVDHRRVGARFLVRVSSASGLNAGQTPWRLRLTDRHAPPMEAGAFIKLKARLTPPAHAALPAGYDFARDAYFAGIGAVGSALGRIEIVEPPAPPGLWLSAMMAVDRARNALAARVDSAIGGAAGAVGAAMVTGKRDLLDEDTRQLIREAGIFHIITISGIQMTLVAGILFWSIRRTLALIPTLALHYPIKKWAALGAIAGAVIYDILTGSRVGTERALLMTVIMMSAIAMDRQALTMRNLALAALCIVAFEPEAILGASFQLSFAAVAALVAVYESRLDTRREAQLADPFGLSKPPPATGALNRLLNWIAHEPSHMLLATVCATSATASFMAYHFHELSPYVLIGNPLTLAIIEFFAVPGALIGTALYPLGLDAPVWLFVGLGIKLALWVASFIAAAPGATVHLSAFAPWSMVFLSLAVLSAVIWRTTLLRLTAVPLLGLGLAGAASGPRYDVLIAPTGDAVAVRGADGGFVVAGAHANAFSVEQWLRADGDGRPAKATALAAKGGEATGGSHCDALGCVVDLKSGGALSIVSDPRAFAEDCGRAAVIVSRLSAPSWCAAALVIDRPKLELSGAQALQFRGDKVDIATARTTGEDRPWSPKPAARRSFAPPAAKPGRQAAPEDAERDDALEVLGTGAR